MLMLVDADDVDADDDDADIGWCPWQDRATFEFCK